MPTKFSLNQINWWPPTGTNLAPTQPPWNRLNPSASRGPTNTNQISFKLRELLLGAPIYEAANHQVEVLQYEAQQLNNSGASSQQQQQQLIEPAECLERLRKSMTFGDHSTDDGHLAHEQQPEAASRYRPLEYKITDLFDYAVSLRNIAIDQDLELQVSPSGVRAVKLVEIL